jgi:hypothetical protein
VPAIAAAYRVASNGSLSAKASSSGGASTQRVNVRIEIHRASPPLTLHTAPGCASSRCRRPSSRLAAGRVLPGAQYGAAG